MRRRRYNVIVIGGGHAGAEAAWAAANLLRSRYLEADGRDGRVALITMDPAKIGAMSCNPAIGGLAKGQMVREIDALGGLMGLAADATGIQFKVLNASKGPAVRGPRCQSDKYAYAAEVQRLLRTRENLDILAGTVEDFVIEGARCRGVWYRKAEPNGPACETDGCCGEFGAIDDYGKAIPLQADAVVLTTGTFMRGLMHTGPRKVAGGRVGEGAAVTISDTLRKLGFELGRLKTGTPPRLAAESIDFASLEVAPGDDYPTPFSELSGVTAERLVFPVLRQVDCHITHTDAAIHDAIRANLDRAPMYNGQIAPGSMGPRYCPSIEDKVVRFADKMSHHVFLEPESLATNEIYCNGISTSLPADVQDFMVHHLPGCENAVILRHGYAVEYDMVLPHQIDVTGMTKSLPGLFLAGQINGTSGYEEAAGQGLVAGVNAVLYGRGDELFRLARDQAYIGVMFDDLVTKTPREPYRMFTSRAEHRLRLRSDNADARLTPLGRELGLVDDARWAVYEAKRDAVASIEDWLTREGLTQWAKNPGVGVADLLEGFERTNSRDATRPRSEAPGPAPASRSEPANLHDALLPRAATHLLAELQYAGYIERDRRQHEKLAAEEQRPLPGRFDYHAVQGLRAEAANTLNKFQPATLGQARRLAGVNPADLMLVRVAVERVSAPVSS